MSDFLGKMKAADARIKLGDLRTRLDQINLDLRRSLDEARRFNDPDLSAQGLEKRREQMATLARQRASKLLEQLQQESRTTAAQMRDWAQGKRPRVEDDPVQLKKLSMAWDRARAMLDAGVPMGEVISRATDPSMLLAIREWGGDYLRASWVRPKGLSGMHTMEPDTSGLARSADERLAQLAGGDTATAVRMLHDLDVFEAAAEPTMRFITGQINGGSMDPAALMAAEYEASMAAQVVQAGWQDSSLADTSPAGDAA